MTPSSGDAILIAGKALAHKTATPSPGSSTEKDAAEAAVFAVACSLMESPYAVRENPSREGWGLCTVSTSTHRLSPEVPVKLSGLFHRVSSAIRWIFN
jgi:hypothetical protein